MSAMRSLSFFQNSYHVFKNELVRNKRDELAVCGLFRSDVYPCPENGIDCVDASPVPRDFDRMADRAFDLAGTRRILFRNDGIQSLGHIVDHVRIADRHFDPPRR